MLRYFALCACLLAPAALHGETTWFVGGLGGISTMSADGKSSISPAMSQISLYKPENGAVYWVIAGWHWNDYLSFQGSYGWNSNSVKLTSTRQAGSEFLYYEQTRRATQHTVGGELMLYFRNRKSFVRPYLSLGLCAAHLTSPQASIEQTAGELPAPGGFSSTAPAVRSAVGMDFKLKRGWIFRYIFSETIRSNAVSRQLTPPADRNMANFQNLFGLVKEF